MIIKCIIGLENNFLKYCLLCWKNKKTTVYELTCVATLACTYTTIHYCDERKSWCSVNYTLKYTHWDLVSFSIKINRNKDVRGILTRYLRSHFDKVQTENSCLPKVSQRGSCIRSVHVVYRRIKNNHLLPIWCWAIIRISRSFENNRERYKEPN